MMSSCPRCALAVLVLLFAAFTGCDTNNVGDRSLGALAGEYALEELRFDPEPRDLSDADWAARLLPQGRASIEVFSSTDDYALLRTPETGRTDLEVRVRSNALEFTAVTPDDEDDLDRLFLPRTFSLAFSDPSARELRADPPLFRQSIDLRPFDPDRYSGLPPVSGRLYISFRRP